MARRQDRKVIKIEAAYGSDRQTFIIKRKYELRVRDVQEDAAKTFRMPVDQIILYWKGRNICDTPNELLETLGIENNHQMRVCRADDPAQRERQRQLRASPTMDLYPSTGYTYYVQQPGQVYSTYPSSYDSTTYSISPRTNYYQQLTSPPTILGPVAATYVVNLQVGFGERIEGLVVGRSHPITVYDLQVELQSRFNIPVLDQNASYNGMSLGQFPPDCLIETLGIVNNSFISLWYKQNASFTSQQPTTDYYSPRTPMPVTYYNDVSPRRAENRNSSPDSMFNGNYPEVVKLEVFHGSDRHLLLLRSINNLRITDLMDELNRITTVPVHQQKLYFRGQELHSMKERTLKELGVDNNSQIRMIGEPTKQRYEPIITAHRAE